jgi:5-hydroxyisourate hydrolase-like protein (transthyretin family)
MRRLALTLLLAAQFFTAQAAQDPGNASIEGAVLNSSNQPIADAQLSLGLDDSVTFSRPPVMTGPDGKFVFGGLKAGNYSIEIRANGYAHQYLAKILGEGNRLRLAVSETRKGLTIRMTRTATVSGRILDAETRDPLAGVPVRLMRIGYGLKGEQRIVSEGLDRTNDRGEYRLYFANPGRYYVGAGGDISTRDGAPPYEEPNVMPAKYPLVYYPRAATTAEATIIDLKPGAEISGIDVVIGKQQILSRIHGHLLDARTAKPPATPHIELYRRAGIDWEAVRDGIAIYRGQTDGSFETRAIAPGSYLLRVYPVASSERPSEPARYAPRLVPVDVVDGDVDAGDISVSPGVQIQGTVTFQGRSPSAEDVKVLSIYVASGSDLFSSPATPLLPSGREGEFTFQFNDLALGEYRAKVFGAKQLESYLKEIKFGAADVLHATFKVSEREIRGLHLVISTTAAVVDGILSNERLAPVAGGTVVLVPDRRDQSDLYDYETTDRDGRFQFRSVAPGNYKVFAWESLELNSYFDAEVLRQVEQTGRPIQITESSKQSLALTAIPAVQ